MTYHKGLVLDFGGVLTTPLFPAALAFEKRAGLPEGTLLDALYLDPEMVRRTEELERGTLTQTQWNTAAGRRCRWRTPWRPSPWRCRPAPCRPRTGCDPGSPWPC